MAENSQKNPPQDAYHVNQNKNGWVVLDKLKTAPLYYSKKRYIWTRSLTLFDSQKHTPAIIIRRDRLIQLVRKFTILDDQENIICKAKVSYEYQWQILNATDKLIGTAQSGSNVTATFFWTHDQAHLLDYKIFVNKLQVAHIHRFNPRGHLKRYELNLWPSSEIKLDYRIGIAMVFVLSWPHVSKFQRKPVFNYLKTKT